MPLFLHPQPHFVADGFELGGIHGETFRGQHMEMAGSFSAYFVAQHVPALFEQPDEEHDFLVAQFKVGAEAAGRENRGCRRQATKCLVTVPAFDETAEGRRFDRWGGYG